MTTLSDTSYTSPLYMTTTSPGGHDSTILPVIIPSGKSPEVCFGCYDKYTPSLQIDDPKSGFCVQLFGAKIANCPPGGGGGGSGGEGDEPTKTDQTTKTNSKTDSTATSTSDQSTKTSVSSSSKSSTTSVTATSQSVLCSVTSDSSSTACVTKAFTTAAECSASGGATTSVSTATSSPTNPICAADTCGSGSCTKKNATRRAVTDTRNSAVRISPRGDPDEGDWVDSDDYSNAYKKMVAGEVWSAYHDDLIIGGDHVEIVLHFRGDAAQYSRRIDQLKTGGGLNDQFNSVGLQDMMGKKGKEGDIGTIFGGDNTGNANNRVFIIAPPPGVNVVDQDGNWLPDTQRQDENANAGQRAFQTQVDDIIHQLAFLGDPNPTVLDYSPKVLPRDLMEKYNTGALEFSEVLSLLGDDGREDHRGSVLLEYQPAKEGCNGANGRQASKQLPELFQAPYSLVWEFTGSWFGGSAPETWF
ncbi:hypothetical protein SCARD494_12807 [Seiridium cardinale]